MWIIVIMSHKKTKDMDPNPEKLPASLIFPSKSIQLAI